MGSAPLHTPLLMAVLEIGGRKAMGREGDEKGWEGGRWEGWEGEGLEGGR